MPREKVGYEDTLKRLDRRFPDREMLCRKDLIEFTGLSRCGLRANYPFAGRYISKVDTARLLSKGASQCSIT